MYRKELLNSGYNPDYISNISDLILNAVKEDFSRMLRDGIRVKKKNFYL